MPLINRCSIVAMIPAKMGSTRFLMKNLALLNGRPLIYYPIKAAKKSGVFTKIVVNAEDAIFSKIAARYNVAFYKRPDEIVSQTTKTDTVIYDFLQKNPCDIVAWISPIAPLQTSGEIKEIVGYFVKERLDSLVTVKNEQVHCVYKGKAVNFRFDEIFAQTQDLIPVQPFVYSVMMWRSKVFMRTFEEKRHALLCGKVGFYPVSKASSIIIKKEEDLMLAESVIQANLTKERFKVRYDKIAGAPSKKVR